MPQLTTAPRVLPVVATVSSSQTSVAPPSARALSTISEDIGRMVEAANALMNRKARSMLALSSHPTSSGKQAAPTLSRAASGSGPRTA
jgi:hypothetical protein